MALVRVILYWALLTPSWDPHFRYRKYAGGRRSLEAIVMKKAGLWLVINFLERSLEQTSSSLYFV